MTRKNKATKPLFEKPQPKKLSLDNLITIEMLTTNQNNVKVAYKQQKNLCLHGIAGTGKSFLSIYFALEEILDPSSKFKKLVLVRSVVPTRDMGFLKGTEEEKIEVYEAPYRSIFAELFNDPAAYDTLKNQGVVQFISTSFIRGLTFNNAILIVDEFENLNFHELDSVITRPGRNCKILFCGDYTQSDFTKTNERNGCLTFMRIIREMKNFSFIEFTGDDIVRGPLVKDYILTKYRLGLNIGV